MILLNQAIKLKPHLAEDFVSLNLSNTDSLLCCLLFLPLFGIGKETIPYISERNPEKVGLKTLGTDIELISEERARVLNPSYMLVLPWYFLLKQGI